MPIELTNSSGVAKIDQILRGVVGVCELCFEGRIRAYYLSGSYSDGSGVDRGRQLNSSDLDVYVVFKDEASPSETDRFRQLIASATLFSQVALDVHPVSEKEFLEQPGELPSFLGVLIKVSGVCVYGEDISSKIELMPLEAYLIHVIDHGFYHMAIARQQGQPMSFPVAVPLRYPLTYPDTAGDYFGYDFRGKPGDPNGTRLLVTCVLWVAALNLALKTGLYSGKKSQTLQLYRQNLNDEWLPYFEEIFQKCKVEWAFAIPENPAEQERLRELSRQALAAENFFLEQAKPILVKLLEGTDSNLQIGALQALQNTIYPDAAIKELLERLATSSNEKVREAAGKTLAIYSPK